MNKSQPNLPDRSHGSLYQAICPYCGKTCGSKLPEQYRKATITHMSCLLHVCLAKRLAKIDNRPAHPEDYQDDIVEIMGLVGENVIMRRIAKLEELGRSGWTDYCEVLTFLKSGVLRDGYTGEILYRE